MPSKNFIHSIFIQKNKEIISLYYPGVVLWEMFSLGKTPYPGIEPGQELYEKLLNNYRMSRPQCCPHDVYKIMLECWNSEPKHRPRFRELADILGDLIGRVGHGIIKVINCSRNTK